VDWSRPTAANRAELAAVHRRLAAAGVAPGAGGYDRAALAAAAAARGWRWAAGPAPPGAAAPYHATVEGGGGGGAPPPAYYAFGWGAEVALARALDRMLRGR
jgi:hypothetical protein